MTRIGLAFAAASLALLCGVATSQDDGDYEQFHVIYEWYKIDFVWPDDTSKARALTSQRYVPENNAISGVKVHGDRLYLTVPRYRDGVPATLASVPVNSPDRNASPRLEPFPSWAMQELGNCSALQFVQNVEVDTEGRMWILDTGRVNIMDRSEPKCPPKLVIVDLNSVSRPGYNAYTASTTSSPSPQDGRTPSVSVINNDTSAKIIRTFQFPDTVASGMGSYLADVVLDPVDGWYAYISDAGDSDPGIIVYSFLENRAWKVRDNASMVADRSAKKFSINGRPAEIVQNVSPLALDVRRRRLLYSPLTSLHLFSIPTAVLRDASKAGEAHKEVVDLGKKLGLSQGFAMDDMGVLYYGLIDDSGIAKWETNKSATTLDVDQHVISKDAVRLQWPTSLGFDDNGHLWAVSNRLHNYIAGRVNLNEANYRVIRGLTRTKSYLHTEGAGMGGDEWAATTPSSHVQDDSASRLSGNGTSTAGWAAVAPGVVAVLGAVMVAKTLS